jgi:hypothetical protein
MTDRELEKAARSMLQLLIQSYRQGLAVCGKESNAPAYI